MPMTPDPAGASASSSRPRQDRLICAAALAWSAATAASVVSPVPPVARAVFVLAFCCWVPGIALFAIVRAWQLVRSPAVSILTSISVIILISQVTLALGVWSPARGTGVLAVACAVLLVVALYASAPVGRRA